MNKRTYTGWKLKTGDVVSETTLQGHTYTYTCVACSENGVKLRDARGNVSSHTHTEVHSWPTEVSKDRTWWFYEKSHFNEELFEL